MGPIIKMTDFNWVVYVHTGGPIIISVSETNHTLPTNILEKYWELLLGYLASNWISQDSETFFKGKC